VADGIVVGRLQRERVVPVGCVDELKARVEWAVEEGGDQGRQPARVALARHRGERVCTRQLGVVSADGLQDPCGG
jgi:hypothetical protein